MIKLFIIFVDIEILIFITIFNQNTKEEETKDQRNIQIVRRVAERRSETVADQVQES